jgi:hypothetical protein
MCKRTPSLKPQRRVCKRTHSQGSQTKVCKRTHSLKPQTRVQNHTEVSDKSVQENTLTGVLDESVQENTLTEASDKVCNISSHQSAAVSVMTLFWSSRACRCHNSDKLKPYARRNGGMVLTREERSAGNKTCTQTSFYQPQVSRCPA